MYTHAHTRRKNVHLSYVVHVHSLSLSSRVTSFATYKDQLDSHKESDALLLLSLRPTSSILSLRHSRKRETRSAMTSLMNLHLHEAWTYAILLLMGIWIFLAALFQSRCFWVMCMHDLKTTKTEFIFTMNATLTPIVSHDPRLQNHELYH